VGINYDRVVEDSNLVRESLGKPRRTPLALIRRTSLWLLGLAWRGATKRFHRFGYAVANFGTPIHVRDLLGDTDLRTLDWEQRKPLLDALAEHLLDSVGREIPLTPVAVVAWAFRSLDAAETSRPVLRDRVFDLLAQAQERGRPVYLPRGAFARSFDVGLRVLVLRRILHDDGGRLSLVAHKAPLLDYYAKSIGHLMDPAPAR
jgi:glycerol-3-phosphate O-acyltransferase